MQLDFCSFAPNILMSAIGSFSVIPSDLINAPGANGSTGFANGAKIRGITINVAGVVSWRDAEGVVQFTSVLPIGNYPMIATGIMLTGTTATSITAWY